MKAPIINPKLNLTSFNCPHCGAFSSMDWRDIRADGYKIKDLSFAWCNHCTDYSLWIHSTMIYPLQISVDEPNEDLPEDVSFDYVEAAKILNLSPRGSAALLRLAIEKLVNQLESEGKDLNTKIGFLVKKGLSPKIQMALDTLRVVGNNAVHPGQLDLNDDPTIAESLFRLVNIIGDEMITRPREVENLFEDLVPDQQKEGIVKRDTK